MLLLNKGKQRLRVHLKLPATGGATLERMLAASPSANDGVTLAGQHLDEDGRRVSALVASTRAGIYAVTLPPYSEALLRGHLAQGTLP